MTLWKNPADGSLHDDCDGEAIKLAVWPAGLVPVSGDEQAAMLVAQATAERKAVILGHLAEVDAASARPAREVADALACGTPMADVAYAQAKLSALNAQAKSLRAELAALG